MRGQRLTNEDLSRALADIKILNGLIPICAGCKKIRDDKGYRQQVEPSIAARSDARFSHGLCPECIPINFPDQDRPAGRGEGENPPA